MAFPPLLLSDYDMSPTHGFLGVDNLRCFPAGPLQAWDDIAAHLSQLTADGDALRDAVDALPCLSTEPLTDENEWRRAYSLLATLANCYVWCKGEDGAAAVLPRQIAVPLATVSEHLGLPPVVTHAAVVLYNWELVDPGMPFSLENITTLHGMHGGTVAQRTLCSCIRRVCLPLSLCASSRPLQTTSVAFG